MFLVNFRCITIFKKFIIFLKSIFFKFHCVPVHITVKLAKGPLTRLLMHIYIQRVQYHCALFKGSHLINHFQCKLSKQLLMFVIASKLIKLDRFQRHMRNSYVH